MWFIYIKNKTNEFIMTYCQIMWILLWAIHIFSGYIITASYVLIFYNINNNNCKQSYSI